VYFLPLSGTNANLRRVRAEDVEGFFALEGDPEIHEMFGGSRGTYRPMTRESAEAMVKHLSEHRFAWVIEHATSRLLKNSAVFAKAAWIRGLVHFDDAPAAGKGLGEAGHLGHQQASAISLGSRTRL
jgi:hypothetical protein